jgi:hypothetical protein
MVERCLAAPAFHATADLAEALTGARNEERLGLGARVTDTLREAHVGALARPARQTPPRGRRGPREGLFVARPDVVRLGPELDKRRIGRVCVDDGKGIGQ